MRRRVHAFVSLAALALASVGVLGSPLAKTSKK
jgi:hypothetical protein